MNDDAPASAGPDSSLTARPRALDTVLYGGLVAGVLDIAYALVFNSLRGSTPARVLQFIASGLLGREAFAGGLPTALLGLLLHFLIAFGVAAVYYGASLRLPVLLRRASLWGAIYGAVVYFVMNYVVLPLSAAPSLRFSLAPFLSGLLVHILCIGLPIALFARRSAGANPAGKDRRTGRR